MYKLPAHLPDANMIEIFKWGLMDEKRDGEQFPIRSCREQADLSAAGSPYPCMTLCTR